jgi:4-hydroxybenzoate polyprenyltransferase
VEFQFCPTCMAYKRMQRIAPYGEQAVALVMAAIMLAWLLSRPSIHWTSWVLAAIVFPMTAYFAWPRKSRRRCEGCGKTTAATESP